MTGLSWAESQALSAQMRASKLSLTCASCKLFSSIISCSRHGFKSQTQTRWRCTLQGAMPAILSEHALDSDS